MKNFKKTTLSLLLASMTLSAVGCTQNQTNSSVENNGNTDNPLRYEKIEETNKYLLQRGKSDYKVVLPAQAEAKEALAADELVSLFAEATNEELQTVTDENIAFNENDKYIFLGDTAVTVAQGLVPAQEELGTGGYIIKTVGNSIFITGTKQTGTLYGVYKFLEYILDYDYYYVDLYGMDKGVADIKLCNYDVSFVPDFKYGMICYGFLQDGSAETDRYSVEAAPSSPVNGGVGHASMYYLPKSKYLNENDPDNYHREWYMEQEGVEEPTQLCFTAHGDSESYKLMVETAAQSLKNEMIKDPDAYMFDCSMTDDHNWCRCAACTAEIEKYNADSVVQVKFLNDMTQNVEDWMETEEGAPYKREFYVGFYAYYSLVKAPAEYDKATGKVTVVDDSVFLNKHVVPQIAELFADYMSSIYSDQNYDMYASFKSWGYLAENVDSYFYCSRYHDYLAPLNTFNDMQELYQFCKEQNVFNMYNLGSGAEYGWSTGWSALRIYLANKLTLDVNMDMEAYTAKFFEEVYQDAGQTMRKFYDEWRYLDELNSVKFPGYAGKSSHYKDIKKAEYFPKTVLDRWLGYIQTALAEIEPLKAYDPDLYARTYKMIIGEAVWLKYFKYEIYKVSMSNEEMTKLKKELAADLRFMGITHWVEGSTIDVYLEQLEG